MKTKIPMYIAVQLESGCGKDERYVWLSLPATQKQFTEAKKAVDPDCLGVTINHYGVKVPGINRYMLAESPLAQVNHLASQLAKLNDVQILKLCAINESEMYFTTLEQVIEYTYNTDKYTLVSDILCEKDLGRRIIENPKICNIPSEIKKHINLHFLGNDVSIDIGGFFTSLGFIYCESEWFGIPQTRHIPASLDLKGEYGEDLYGEFEYTIEK